ncbi:MAG: hypothetical protein ACRCYF_18220 [Shewanella sp.]
MTESKRKGLPDAPSGSIWLAFQLRYRPFMLNNDTARTLPCINGEPNCCKNNPETSTRPKEDVEYAKLLRVLDKIIYMSNAKKFKHAEI